MRRRSDCVFKPLDLFGAPFHALEPGRRLGTEFDDILDGVAVLLLELLDKVEPVADPLKPVGIELHTIGIGRHLARNLFDLRPACFAQFECRSKPIVDGRNLFNARYGLLEPGQDGIVR